MEWLTPVLALVGVVVATSAGLYQYKRTARRDADSPLLNARAAVLRQLLDRLHDLEVRSRSEQINTSDLNRELIRLNKDFIAEYSVVLTRQEKQWGRDYIEGLVAVHMTMQDTAVQVYEWWASTADQSIPVEVQGAFKRIQMADAGLGKSLRRAMRGRA